MPRKKKEPVHKTSKHVEGCEVLIGFIKFFEYTDGVNEDMLGHPKEGRCYRIIKDKIGYRLHIGRENNNIGLDGLYLGESLKASKATFTFEIVLVTPQNFLDLGISKEDIELVTEWIKTDNEDMWEKLRVEHTNGDPVVMNSIDDFLELTKALDPGFPESGNLYNPELNVPKIGETDSRGLTHADVDDILEVAVNTISDNDPYFFLTVLQALQHLASKYDDAQVSDVELSKKTATESIKLGEGANMHAIIESVEQYSAPIMGSDLTPLYRILTHTLYEIQRRRFLTEKLGKK